MSDMKPTAYSEFLSLIRPGRRFNLLSLDPYVAEGRLAMPYRYFPGPVATRFFQELRDHQRILGIRCPKCNTVYVPPLSTCGRCFEALENWVEVGTKGVLQSFTMTHYTLPIHPGPAPLIHGLVRLDGADTGLLHLLGEADALSLKIGMRVEAVFKDERAGNILDIRYFRPARSR
jgi:hypothetical protein